MSPPSSHSLFPALAWLARSTDDPRPAAWPASEEHAAGRGATCSGPVPAGLPLSAGTGRPWWLTGSWPVPRFGLVVSLSRRPIREPPSAPPNKRGPVPAGVLGPCVLDPGRASVVAPGQTTFHRYRAYWALQGGLMTAGHGQPVLPPGSAGDGFRE